ncbi:hypothetical protein ACTHUL_11135, partial [Neisseria sp. P0024.S002]
DEENPEEDNPEEKGDETTGKEVMSVDNITDEKDTAEKVEARSEQIVDKREETEEAEKAEEEEGENGDTSEESDTEKSEDGNESEGEVDKSEGNDETEEVSKESFEYLKGLGIDLSKVKVTTEVSQESFGSPECIKTVTPPPVEVTQGEVTEEEPEVKENPYEPSLDAIVKMSKFQEGERDFDVKSADEWK